MSNTRWYVESWFVTDGLAFASERTDAGTIVNVVFLAPPYWSPVAVANVSTAWAAHRASFQHGFFDAEGENEIGFASLAEIREVLRRAYLASGYGTFPTGEDGEGGEIAPLPGGDGGEGGGGFDEVAARCRALSMPIHGMRLRIRSKRSIAMSLEAPPCRICSCSTQAHRSIGSTSRVRGRESRASLRRRAYSRQTLSLAITSTRWRLHGGGG